MIDRPDKRKAALAAIHKWYGRGQEIGDYIEVNEHGFEDGFINGEDVFNTSNLLSNID